jgi:hypothetical protein
MTTTASTPALSAYRMLDPEQRSALWSRVRSELAGDGSESVATELWADLLHDPDHVVECWRALTEPLPDRIALARVLDICGPVPADHKFPLLEELAADPGWHDPLIRALWFATFEDHGDIDVPRARRLLERLRPGIAASEHEDVVAALEQLPADCRSWSHWQQRDGELIAVAMPRFASARAATELERRRGERRSRDIGPPSGLLERRRVPDRREPWGDFAPVEPVEQVEQGEQVSGVARDVQRRRPRRLSLVLAAVLVGAALAAVASVVRELLLGAA